jgi:tRNA-2-methylthio-N6-dimethylallyladenosine synthase
MNEDIFRAVAELETVCEHVHMPAQSGADPVLRRMNRHYDHRHYLNMIERGRDLVPDLAFSSDFIVGFPGETESDFDKTLALLEMVQFQQSYIFRYSPRPGTRAAEMEDDVPDEVKRERQQRLLLAQERIDTERRAAMVGQTVKVLCEAENTSHPEEGRWRGRTRANDIVVFSAPETSPGDERSVRIHDSSTLTLFGQEVNVAETPVGR